MRVSSRTLIGGLVLPLMAAGLVTGCGKHSSSSSTSAGAGSSSATAKAVGTSSCHPLSKKGNCYEPGQDCRVADHGKSGVAGDGKSITCQDKNGWRWETV